MSTVSAVSDPAAWTSGDTGSHSRTIAIATRSPPSRGADTGTAPCANTDPASYPAITRCTASASSTDRANTEIVSIERQAGTMPRAETLPIVGFSPTILPNAAGTRPDPAVSVPSAKAHDAGGDRARRSGGRTARHIGADRTRCAARHTGCACRPGRWRTDPDWSCRSAARPRPAGAARRARSLSRCRQSRGTPPWSASRRRRCCPSPRTARPRAAACAGPPPRVRRARARITVVRQAGDPDRRIVVRAIGGDSAASAASIGRHAAIAPSMQKRDFILLAPRPPNSFVHRQLRPRRDCAQPHAHQRDQQIAQRHRRGIAELPATCRG